MNHGYKHGSTLIPEYRIYRGMRGRFLNPNIPAYKNYGGRGITISEEWLSSFEIFYKDMGERPSPNHTLERIDNNGPYAKENCSWVPRHEQAHNKRNNAYITYHDETLHLAEWARRTGQSYATIRQRLKNG